MHQAFYEPAFPSVPRISLPRSFFLDPIEGAPMDSPGYILMSRLSLQERSTQAMAHNIANA
ncbi:MAG: hypothetical protein ACK530_04745, partial [Alphaproteobacteria bacterium]